MQAAAKVLIVDDALFLRMLLRDILLKLGCDVAGEASDGQEALDLYPQIQPDAVFVDLFMPNIDGISTLREILKKDPNARVIACSSNNKEEFVREAMLNGAMDYLIKPLDEAKVGATLRRVLRLKPGNPRSIIEELLAWHDLGDMVVRLGLTSPEALEEARAAVRDGKQPTLAKALTESAGISPDELHAVMEDVHKDVSLALIILQARLVTMQQLRYSLRTIRNSGRRLGFTLIEHGFCNQAQLGEFLKKVPPYKRTEL